MMLLINIFSENLGVTYESMCRHFQPTEYISYCLAFDWKIFLHKFLTNDVIANVAKNPETWMYLMLAGVNVG